MTTYKRVKPATAGPDQFISQFINVIAANNNLLMDEFNVIYFAPKLWLYVMAWLPRTTDNSISFAQPLEIGGIESRQHYQNISKGTAYIRYTCQPNIIKISQRVFKL